MPQSMSLLRMIYWSLNARAHVTLTHLTQLMQVSKDIVGWWDIVPNVCQESVLLPPVKMPLGQQEDNTCQEKL